MSGQPVHNFSPAVLIAQFMGAKVELMPALAQIFGDSSRPFIHAMCSASVLVCGQGGFGAGSREGGGVSEIVFWVTIWVTETPTEFLEIIKGVVM